MLQSLVTDLLHCAIDERVVLLNSASDACVSLLAQQLSAGELVLAEDSLAAASQARSVIRKSSQGQPRLREIPFHEYTLHQIPATMDVAIMNILYQPNNAWMYYGVQLAHYTLKAGGRLYIEGAKDRGILSLGKRVQEIFGNVETLKISKGQRVLCARKLADAPGEVVAPILPPFAEGKMDEGTAELLTHLQVHATDVALDIGCGSGFIGAYIAERAVKGQVTMVDVSRASVAAAQRFVDEQNLSNIQVLASDGTEAVRDQRFDLVVTNPPFHLGGIQTTAIAERFIREAAQILRPRGRFYLVANRFLKYEPVMRECFETVEEVGGNSRFKVLRALAPVIRQHKG